MQGDDQPFDKLKEAVDQHNARIDRLILVFKEYLSTQGDRYASISDTLEGMLRRNTERR